MNKDFWEMLKKFVEPIEETNDKIKTEKEMIISVCEEQLKNNYKNCNPDIIYNLPSDDEIETAALNYRDESDDKNTNESTMIIESNWYDKQEAFTAGVKWFLGNYR